VDRVPFDIEDYSHGVTSGYQVIPCLKRWFTVLLSIKRPGNIVILSAFSEFEKILTRALAFQILTFCSQSRYAVSEISREKRNILMCIGVTKTSRWLLVEMGEDYGVVGLFDETGGFHVV
jgi:hypothetical protein